ncbi:MAG: hypothetical protein Q4G27_01275 [Flavobacteriaceae bacterium]|nr:hypothetical protein [Flavobacteriaceae bacterium]
MILLDFLSVLVWLAIGLTAASFLIVIAMAFLAINGRLALDGAFIVSNSYKKSWFWLIQLPITAFLLLSIFHAEWGATLLLIFVNLLVFALIHYIGVLLKM